MKTHSLMRTGFRFGGEQGIRTLETLLMFTRFPIVLLRPARTTLHNFKLPCYYTKLITKNQVLIYLNCLIEFYATPII